MLWNSGAGKDEHFSVLRFLGDKATNSTQKSSEKFYAFDQTFGSTYTLSMYNRSDPLILMVVSMFASGNYEN